MPVLRSLAQFHSVIAILLAMTLLLAQWSGLSHRIDHAPWLQGNAALLVVGTPADTGSSHSCVAFDAAAVADVVSVPPYIAPLLASTSVLALWVAFSSWDAPSARLFCSRAPPRA